MDGVTPESQLLTGPWNLFQRGVQVECTARHELAVEAVVIDAMKWRPLEMMGPFNENAGRRGS